MPNPGSAPRAELVRQRLSRPRDRVVPSAHPRGRPGRQRVGAPPRPRAPRVRHADEHSGPRVEVDGVRPSERGDVEPARGELEPEVPPETALLEAPALSGVISPANSTNGLGAAQVVPQMARGAATASHGSRPRSTTPEMTETIVGTTRSLPAPPITRSGLPSFRTIVGVMEVSAAFPGMRWQGCEGLVRLNAFRFEL